MDFPIKPIFPNRTLAHPLAYPPPTYMPHPALATATLPATVVPTPQIIPQESLTLEMQVMANKINDLTSQLGELRIHQMGAWVKKDQLVDDRANVWCTNCRGQGHMKLDCPSPQALAPKCRYCGGDHDISSCTRMINEGQRRNRNGQVNQVEKSGDDNGSNNNNSNNNNGNNNGNWNKNRNRRNFNQGGNFNYDQNNNYGNYNQSGNFNPNFNPINFNNGGYNNNPNRYIPQVPMNYNQGWNQMPYGNPSQGTPTYGGQNPRWAINQRPKGNLANVVCFRCHQMGHIVPNCPNPMAEISYIPLCGNCKQNGHTSEECNAPKRAGPRDNDGYVKRDPTAKLVLIPKEFNTSVHCNMNCVEIEDISNGDYLHLIMVQQVQTRRQRGEEALLGQSSQLGLNSYSKDVTPEQPKLVEQTPLEQPKLDVPAKEPVPNSVDITHPIWLEPVEDTPDVPKAQPVGAGSSSVFNLIRINPVINK